MQVAKGTRVDRLSILGDAYFDFNPGSVAHSTLIQRNSFFPAVTAIVLCASVLQENVPTP